MVNSKTSLKNRAFGIPIKLDELLQLYSTREGISVSQMIRISVKEKIDQLIIEEEKFWMKLEDERVDEILLHLIEYLQSRSCGEGYNICKHSKIWKKNYDENFQRTSDFCNDLQIELNGFLKKIEADFKRTFNCECELYHALINKGYSDDM